jgi:elongation of very long chain fatty acids protein 6
MENFNYCADYLLEFKENFGNKTKKWLKNNWSISLYISFAYVILIFGLQSFMKNRSPYELRKSLIVWNLLLALFSILGTIYCLPFSLKVLVFKGFDASVCENLNLNKTSIELWHSLFVWSKVFELGDTLFIVLRKKRLIFLHWIHHLITLCYSFYSYWNESATIHWMISINFFVHSIMYSYYCLKAMKFQISTKISIFITSLQILQMIFGFFINFHALRMHKNKNKCEVRDIVARVGVGMYLLYFSLFFHLFMFSYVLKPKRIAKLVNNSNKKST